MQPIRHSIVLAALSCVPASAQQVLQSWPPAPGETPQAVAAAGDVDRDGTGDLALVEANLALASSRLRVFSPASATPLLDLSGVPEVPGAGSALLALGDVNGDGRSDLAVGGRGRIEAYSGADGTVLWTRAVVGDTQAFALVDDFDADGRADLLAGIPITAGTLAGEALVLSSSSGIVLRTLVAPAGASSRFGFAVAAAGDRDGDGVGEFLIGDWGVNNSRGSVQFFSGASAQPLSSLQGPQNAQFYGFGYAVAELEDLDGDGVDDFAFAAPFACLGGGYEGCGASGRIHIRSGASLAELHLIHTPGALSFGLDLEPFADLDGDGVRELLVSSGTVRMGCCNYNAGSVFVVSPRTGQVFVRGFAQTNGAVARIDDLDGDGIPEYLSAVSLFGDVRSELSLTRVQPVAELACSASTNSAGCVPTLTGYGGPSLSGGGDLDLQLSGLVPGRAVQLLWSPESAARPLVFGTLCVGSPFARSAAVGTQLDPYYSTCGHVATVVIPGSQVPALGAAGTRFRAQALQRDPAGEGLSLSSSLVVTIWP